MMTEIVTKRREQSTYVETRRSVISSKIVAKTDNTREEEEGMSEIGSENGRRSEYIYVPLIQ